MRRIAVALMAAGLPVAITACGGDDGETRTAATAGCHARVDRGVLPAWARGGFSDPQPKMPHVIGRSGRIAAILFGDRLTSPPRRKVNNKILWVARTPPRTAADLRIRARRYAGGRAVGDVVRRKVARGPGPSIIDLPAPGCWRLDLRWGDRGDTLDLRYVPP